MTFPDITFFPLEVKRPDTVIHFSGRNVIWCYDPREIAGMPRKGFEARLGLCFGDIQQQKYDKTGPDFISFLQSWDLIIQCGFHSTGGRAMSSRTVTSTGLISFTWFLMYAWLRLWILRPCGRKLPSRLPTALL
jgi:hypothetical protein